MQRIIYALVLFALLGNTVFAQVKNDKFNKTLADSLGADEYGMCKYQFVILKTGDSTLKDKKKITELFSAHITNIKRLVADGKLIVAGPFEKNDKNYRGLFILKVATKKEAEQLLLTDAAVKSGLLSAEIFGWFGSAALPKYLPYHEEVAEKVF